MTGYVWLGLPAERSAARMILRVWHPSTDAKSTIVISLGAEYSEGVIVD
jgi:hypothetical protein